MVLRERECGFAGGRRRGLGLGWVTVFDGGAESEGEENDEKGFHVKFIR